MMLARTETATCVRLLTIPCHETAAVDALPGERIADVIERAGWARRSGKRWHFTLPTICVVNGSPVLQRQWRRRRIKASDHVAFIARPMGGGGGNRTKSIIGIVGAIALAAFAPWAAGTLLGLTGFAATLVSGAITLGGALLLNALVTPKAGGQNAQAAPLGQVEQLYSVGAQGNAARPFEPIPVQYGMQKIAPDYAAQPWSEFVGNDQYLNLLLCRGLGKYEVHQLLTDDTVVWDAYEGVSAAFDGVTIEHYDPGETVSLFPINVTASVEVSGQTLPDGSGGAGYIGGFIANASGTQANALAVDLVFPSGCFTIAGDGTVQSNAVAVVAEYRPVDSGGSPTGSYAQLFSQTFSFATRTPQRVTVKSTVSNGRYEVRVRRTSAPASTLNASNDVAWAGLRAFLTGSPVSFDASITALRIKATPFTQESVRRFSVVQTRILPVWDDEEEMFVDQATRNPLWAFYDIASNAEYGPARPPSKIDFQTVVTMAAAADERGDTFDFQFRAAVPAPEAFDTALKVARSRHRWSGDILTVVRDQWSDVPRMLLTDREIVRDSVSIDYALNSEDSADCVIVEFVDETTWRPAEAQYPPDSIEFTAQNPARIRIDGLCSRQKAFEEAAFFYLQSAYRRTRMNLATEHDGRMLGFGDCVRVQTELPESYGESAAVVGRQGMVLTASRPLAWAPSGQHYIEVRTARGRMFGPVKCSKADNDNLALIEIDDTDLALVETQQSMTLADALAREEGGEEPSFAFGVGEKRARNCLVVSGRKSGDRVSLSLVVNDPLAYPPEDIEEAPVAPAAPLLSDSAAPLVVGLFANFRQGQLEPVLDASWFPSAGAFYYRAQVSYDLLSWTQVYEGAQPNFSAVVDRADLRLRVQAVGLRAGAYSSVDVDAPDIALAANTVSPESLRQGLREYVMEQLGAQNEALNFLSQRIAALAAEQDAQNYLEKRATRVILDERIGDTEVLIQETATIVEEVDGRLSAAWLLSINNDGHVSGIFQYNDGLQADLIVVADSFLVAAPGVAGGAPVPIFQVANVDGEGKMTLRGDMIADGSIDVQKLNVSELFAITASFGDATVDGKITSQNSKLEIDFDNNRIVVYD